MNFFIAPVEFSNVSVLHSIVKNISGIFKDKVSVISLPVNTAAAFSRDRGQYFSTQLIADAIKLTSGYDGKVLMLVEFDLFVPVFTYVFGEAQLNGKHSIVSVCRLHEEFYSGKTNDKLFIDRTIKEILHELGHNMGLIHCRSWDCVMHSSQGVEEIDIKGQFYCPDCMEILSDNGFKDSFAAHPAD